jgi:hypothetical protein
LNFIAVGFTPRDKYVYKHRLIGLEADWIESNEPYAQYPYLPPENIHLKLFVEMLTEFGVVKRLHLLLR